MWKNINFIDSQKLTYLGLIFPEESIKKKMYLIDLINFVQLLFVKVQ